VLRSQLGVRWVVLLLTCILLGGKSLYRFPYRCAQSLSTLSNRLSSTGSYYCYDNPSALESQLEQHFLGTAYSASFDVYFNLLYTVYSIPNVVLPFYGGFLVDKIGVRIMIVLFAVFIFIGQILLAIGVQMRSMPLMLIGRTLFGLGGESLSVGQSALIAAWFKDKELAFALGINLSIGRLGSVINDKVSPLVAASMGLASAFWVGAVLCACSLCAAVLLVCIDTAVDRKKGPVGAGSSHGGNGGYFSTPRARRKPGVSGVRSSSPYGSINSNSQPPTLPSSTKASPLKKPKTPNETLRLTDIRYFPATFWLLVTSCVVVYGAVLPFNNIASGFLQTKYYLHGAVEPTTAAPGRRGGDGIADAGEDGGASSGEDGAAGGAGGQSFMNGSRRMQDSAFGRGIGGAAAVWFVAAGGVGAAGEGGAAGTGNEAVERAAVLGGGHIGRDSDKRRVWAGWSAWLVTTDGSTTDGYADGGSEISGTPRGLQSMYNGGTINNGHGSYHAVWAQSSHVPPSCSTVDLEANKDWAAYCTTKASAIATSATVMMIPYTISAVASPFLGYVVDRFGGRAWLALIAPILLVSVHLLFAMGGSDISPVYGMAGMGIAYSIFAAALWPSVPLCVKPSHVGTAYGTITAMQNLGLALLPVPVGYIFELSNNQYAPVEFFFSGLAGAGVLCGIVLNYLDAHNGHLFNRPWQAGNKKKKQARKGGASGKDEARIASPRQLLVRPLEKGPKATRTVDDMALSPRPPPNAVI
jgi:nitrate/nitrite transporter NarK